jgi:hypothetical protein
MQTLIDHHLAEVPLQQDYPHYTEDHSFFCGYMMKSNYDETRLSINKNLSPKRATFATSTHDYKLYGLFQTAPYNHMLVSALVNTPPNNINEYNSLLTSNGLTCFNCFLHFSPQLYPIDSAHIDKFFPTLDLDHAFSGKNKIPPFQRLSHIYLLCLINHKK